MEKKYDIFISYSRKDIEKVRPIIDELEARDFKIWLDLSNIDYGDTFPDRIADALDASSSLLFMCTRNSINATYCKKEIGYARTNRMKIRAILVDGYMPKKGWFALDYQDVNCINITNDDQKRKLFDELESVYQPQKAIERDKKIREAKAAVRRKVQEEEERKIKEAEQKALKEELARLRKKEDKRIRKKFFYLDLISHLTRTRQNIIHYFLQTFLFTKRLGEGILRLLCKLKKHLVSPIVYIPLLLASIVLITVYSWGNKYDLFPSFFSLEERLGYAEVGENVDGYRLVKTYGGKYAFIQSEEPWNLCTDTIYTDFTEMKDSIAWLRDYRTSSWSCFYGGEIRNISHYTQIVKFPDNDSIAFFLFNREIFSKQFLPNSEYNALRNQIESIKKGNSTYIQQNSKQSTGGKYSSTSNSKSMLDSLSQKIALYANTNIPSLTDTLAIDSLKMHYGVINKSGDILIPPVLDGIGEHTQEYVVARCNGLWGLVNYESRKLPEFEFENKFSYEQRQYSNVMKKGKWGLIDKSNKIIIKIENDSIGYNFYNNLIRVNYNGLWGFKDANDKFIIKPIYKSAKDFQYGYAAVKDNKTNKWLYVNNENKSLPISINGITTSEPYFDVACNFHREWSDENDTIILAKIGKDEKFGYIRLISNKASEFTRCTYDDLSTLNVKGYCKYKEDGKYGILYYSSQKTKAIYDDIPYPFGLGLGIYYVEMNGTKGGIKLQENGNVITIIPIDYKNVDYCIYGKSEFYHVMNHNNKWGLYSTSMRKEMIPCKYDSRINKDDNFCIVRRNGKDGLYSISNHKEILPCIYSDIRYHKESKLIEVTKSYKEKGVYDLNAKKWIGKGPIYYYVSIYTDKVGLQDENHKFIYYPIKH